MVVTTPTGERTVLEMRGMVVDPLLDKPASLPALDRYLQ